MLRKDRTRVRRQIQNRPRRPQDKSGQLQLRILFQGLTPGAALISHVIMTYSRPKFLMLRIARFGRSLCGGVADSDMPGGGG